MANINTIKVKNINNPSDSFRTPIFYDETSNMISIVIPKGYVPCNRAGLNLFQDWHVTFTMSKQNKVEWSAELR